jgi:hypothetical protein
VAAAVDVGQRGRRSRKGARQDTHSTQLGDARTCSNHRDHAHACRACAHAHHALLCDGCPRLAQHTQSAKETGDSGGCCALRSSASNTKGRVVVRYAASDATPPKPTQSRPPATCLHVIIESEVVPAATAGVGTAASPNHWTGWCVSERNPVADRSLAAVLDVHVLTACSAPAGPSLQTC